MSNSRLKIPQSKFSLILPQSYDNTITFTEYMNKLLYAFEHITVYADYTVSTAYNENTKNLHITIRKAPEDSNNAQ